MGASKSAFEHTPARQLTCPDGAVLTYRDSGGSLPPCLLVNGLGGPMWAWRHQVRYFVGRFRFLGWDYRGLFPRSGEPRPAAVDVPTQADDLRRVLDAARVERCVAVAWSMGAQVLLEAASREPDRFGQLVLLNGTLGATFERIGAPLARRVLPVVAERARPLREGPWRGAFKGVGSALFKQASRWPETTRWLKRVKLVGGTLDEGVFRELAEVFADIDVSVALRMVDALAANDPLHHLRRIPAPVLVIHGTLDPLTPATAVQDAVELRRDAGLPVEYLEVRGATHYTLLEQPELVNLRIEKFLKEHGFPLLRSTPPPPPSPPGE